MRKSFNLVLLSSASLISLPAAVHAQESAPPQDGAVEVSDMEIIVTARKRSETLINVPVAITAVSANELSRSAINGTDALARKIPGFVVGEGGGTTQGGSISLRGISAADANPLGDQAVSFNIDGVQVARSSIRRMGDFDIASVEVLKGPQALFFGKNSPGGIISTRTADPTDKFEAGVKAGYEFVAREIRGEGYISGPLTESLGARLAFYGSTMDGWTKSLVPASDPLYAGSRAPDKDEFAFRGTLKFNNGGPFRARFKLAYNQVKDNSSTSNVQNVNCAGRIGATNGGTALDDCKPNDRGVFTNLGTALGNPVGKTLQGTLGTAANPTGNPRLGWQDFGDGVSKSKSKQWLSALELNYDITDQLELTSVTGYYDLNYFNRANFTQTNRPTGVLASVNLLEIREISEEVRLASSFDGPVNFLIGAQYQDSRATSASLAAFGVNAVGTVANYALLQNGEAYSAFGQVQVKPMEQIEISVGGRYSHEEKELKSVVNNGLSLVNSSPLLSNGRNKKKFNNFSPEISVSYRPTSDLNIYANYKRGFLSGGFNGGSANPATDLSYNPQKVKGFEAGVKGRFLDGLLTAELAAYTYKIDGLQVQVTEGVFQVLRNAGKVSSKGIEASLTLRPTRGLSLYGNVAYAKGRYDQYFASCYKNQGRTFSGTIIPGTNPGTGIGQCQDDGTKVLGQNLSGTQLIRSPKWTGNTGFVYETPLTSNMKVELASGISFSDSYITNANSTPNGRSPNYVLLDASLRIAQADDKWELALIGRNLTDKYYFVRTSDNPGNVTAMQLPDLTAAVSRGREVMVRVGFKY